MDILINGSPHISVSTSVTTSPLQTKLKKLDLVTNQQASRACRKHCRQILPKFQNPPSKTKKVSRNDESNLLISAITAVSRQLRQGYLRTSRMQEPRRELVLICNLDPHFMIPPPHSSPLAHFTSQKAGGKCHMKARSGGSKKLPYLHPCHPVIFHPTFSAYRAHGPLQTVLHAIFLQSEKQAQVQLGGVSVSVIGLLAHSDVA